VHLAAGNLRIRLPLPGPHGRAEHTRMRLHHYPPACQCRASPIIPPRPLARPRPDHAEGRRPGSRPDRISEIGVHQTGETDHASDWRPSAASAQVSAVVIGQRARGGCPAEMLVIQERPPGAIVRAWCPNRSEEDVLWVRVAARRGVTGGGMRGGSGCGGVGCQKSASGCDLRIQGRSGPSGMMISRVDSLAVPDLHPALWLAGPARPAQRHPRASSCSCCGTRSPCCAALVGGPGWTGPTALSSPR
jgi:hypothetical protein